MASINVPIVPKQFVLCFDGTGNKFSGDESDSNVLKIFRMLDRSKSHQFHYYQPGIGTYVTDSSLAKHGRIHRIRSAYLKAKDSAIGSSFAEHVLGGYKFLMRYYSPGDEIYFIGFSRGAYVARFLAEMLDYIGLLEAGNEELIRFAWKTFAKWQQRRSETEEDRIKKKELFAYMKAFRETFSRPITRIRFLGLFDTVNSVPAFESAWMQRSKFPYTARSSARVIRHAVGIDERRAKFRQDLISEQKPWQTHAAGGHHHHNHNWAAEKLHMRSHQSLRQQQNDENETVKPENVPAIVLNDNLPEVSVSQPGPVQSPARNREQRDAESSFRTSRSSRAGSAHNDEKENRYRAPSSRRRLSLTVPIATASTEDLVSIQSGISAISLQVPHIDIVDDYDDDESVQDIQEVWFPGCHADIGGGWKLADGEKWALSHAPLVWMVQEAQKFGLQFDERKLKQFECIEDSASDFSASRDQRLSMQVIETPAGARAGAGAGAAERQDLPVEGEHITFDVPALKQDKNKEKEKNPAAPASSFLSALELSSTHGVLHDCLDYNRGLPFLSVLAWRMMEYLPFRRMDLQPDGSWKPIRWPLPCGEVRDIPFDAHIHVSAIRRLKSDPNYRPGNLIIGGGGRGVRRAPKEYGIGDWVVLGNEGDWVRETYVRKSVSKRCKEDSHSQH